MSVSLLIDELLAHRPAEDCAVLTRQLARIDTDLLTILREAIDRQVSIGRKHELRQRLAADERLHRRVWRLIARKTEVTRSWLSAQELAGERLGLERAMACLTRYEADRRLVREASTLGEEPLYRHSTVTTAPKAFSVVT